MPVLFFSRTSLLAHECVASFAFLHAGAQASTNVRATA
jgi:hypothetical protein